MSRLTIMYYIITIISIKKYECFTKTSNNAKIEQISEFLEHELFATQKLPDSCTVGIFKASENPVYDDIVNAFLSKTRQARLTTSIIITKIPDHQLNRTMTLRLTIVFVDHIEDSVDIVKKLLSCCKNWDIYSKYILIVLNEFNTVNSIEALLKAMWVENKLVNLGIVHIDFSNDLQVVTYNPYKDEILSSKLSESLTLFPNKLKNLYGHIVPVTWWIIHPYAFEEDGTIKGSDFDFLMTFLKAINATPKLIRKINYDDGGRAVMTGEAEIACLSSFLFEELLMLSAYPSRFMDLTVLVKNPKHISSFGNLLLIFDKFTWILILCVFVVFHVLMQIRLKCLNLERHQDIGLKILIFSFSIYSIIFTQAFQSWITTFLIHPKPVKQINTIDDLIESKLELYAVDAWESLLSSNLQDQYIFRNMSYFRAMLDGERVEHNKGYVVTLDFVKSSIPYLAPKIVHDNVYHQVEELVGSAYMVFYLCPNCPYKEILNEISLRSLAYGHYSKDWGRLTVSNLEIPPVATELKLLHLRNVFFIWLDGITISILMFTAELLWYLYTKLL